MMKHLEIYEKYVSDTRHKGDKDKFPIVGSEVSVDTIEGYSIGDIVIIDDEKAEIIDIIEKRINEQPNYWFKIQFEDGTVDVVPLHRL